VRETPPSRARGAVPVRLVHRAQQRRGRPRRSGGRRACRRAMCHAIPAAGFGSVASTESCEKGRRVGSRPDLGPGDSRRRRVVLCRRGFTTATLPPASCGPSGTGTRSSRTMTTATARTESDEWPHAWSLTRGQASVPTGEVDDPRSALGNPYRDDRVR
jgi:hypothetical protein